MSLETSFVDMIARLGEVWFPNEQAVSQGIVVRVLQDLDRASKPPMMPVTRNDWPIELVSGTGIVCMTR